jgi:hypothetical protein
MDTVRICNEGHDAYGVLICKFGVSSVAEVEAFFGWLARHITGGDDEVSDTGPDAVYTAARGFRLYPHGLWGKSHPLGQRTITFEDWNDRDPSEPDCAWEAGMSRFDPREAIVYFDIVFEDYNLEEDERSDGDGEERYSLTKWRELTAKFEKHPDKWSMAAIECEFAAVRYLQKQFTELFAALPEVKS